MLLWTKECISLLLLAMKTRMLVMHPQLEPVNGQYIFQSSVNYHAIVLVALTMTAVQQLKLKLVDDFKFLYSVTVGATDRSDQRSSFSNYGTCVNIFAPVNLIAVPPA